MMPQDSSSNHISSSAEKAFNEFSKCVFRLQRSLCTFGKKSQSGKRIRLDQGQSVREKFEDALKALEQRFIEATKALFSHYPDNPVLESIAKDTIQSLTRVKSKLKIDEECYKLAVESVITPIIKTLLEEEELNRAARTRQESRKQFIKQILLANYDPRTVQSDRAQDQSSSSNCALSTSSSENLAANYSLETSNSDNAESSDAFIICDTLFDALGKHTETIVSDVTDYSPRIFHIINISHVIEVIRWYLRRIKLSYEKDSQARLTAQNTDFTLEALVKYRSRIENDLAKFEPDNPLVIFQMELKSVLVQILALQCLVRR